MRMWLQVSELREALFLLLFCYTFAENDITMEAPNRIQTAIRLSPELYERVKRNARREHRSFNSYVEHVLDKSTELVFPKISDDYEVSEEIKALGARGHMVRPSQEELDADPKLAYLVEKYGI